MARIFNDFRMYILSAASILPAVLLSGCSKPGTDSPLPEIIPDITGSLLLPAEGGPASIAYSIAGHADDGKLSAAASEDWLDGFDCGTDGTVAFTVLPNEDTEDRSAVITLTYTWAGTETVTKQINAIQKGKIPYDFEFLELDKFYGIYYGDINGINGEHNYNITISDKELEGNGDYITPGGTYYMLDFFAGAPSDPENPSLPSGTYTLGTSGSTSEMTFSKDFSKAAMLTEDGDYIFNTVFTDGTASVSYEGSTITIEAFLTDADSKTHHIRYSGEAVFHTDGEDSITTPVIDHDINLDVQYASAMYASRSGDVMEVNISLEDEQTILHIEAFMPFDETGAITAGQYLMSSDVYTPSTIYPGETAEFMGGVIYMGTYAEQMGEDGSVTIGLAADGCMSISSEAGDCVISCSITTAEGYSITADWRGPLSVTAIPDPISTLTGDYTLDLTEAEATADYCGDYYGTGGSDWRLTITSTTGSDSFQTDFVTSGTSYSDGIGSGTYTGVVDFPSPGQYLIGWAMGDYTGGTLYLGGENEIAPAVSGDMTITDNGDGTHTVSFAFTDDAGHIWDGNWTGVINTRDISADM